MYVPILPGSPACAVDLQHKGVVIGTEERERREEKREGEQRDGMGWFVYPNGRLRRSIEILCSSYMILQDLHTLPIVHLYSSPMILEFVNRASDALSKMRNL
jgi:hypothetical protein